MIAFTTVVIAAKSARGRVSSDFDSPTASSFAASPLFLPKRSLCSAKSRARMPDSVSSGARPINARNAPRFRAASSFRKCVNSCAASTRAASTNCGSLSSTSDWSGVAVTSRLAVQTSRDTASNVAIDGGGEVRRQNVYTLRR